MTQDKRVVTDFRHLNIRIGEEQYSLSTFLVLGNSKCKVFSVLDLKDAFHSLRLLEDSKRYCIFWKCIIYVSENASGIGHFTLDLGIIHKCNLRMLTE